MNRKNTKPDYRQTDYDIPVFSWRSAFLIGGVTFALTVLTVWLSRGSRFWIIFVLSLSMSLTTAYSRFFIDTGRGMGKGFWMTACILFAACFIVLQFVQF